MIRAYDKSYLSKSQSNLAVMFEFAVYDLKFSLEDFIQKFLHSEVSGRIEAGDFSVIAGRSGVELALEIAGDFSKADRYCPSADRSPEYWAGWVLAYFQWYSSLSFSRILKTVPVSEIVQMYNPYHEMDIIQFCDRMTELYKSRNPVSNLKRIRLNCGMSQSELARESEVPLKTIQQYEQRQKNINSAKAETLVRFSKVLNCPVEDFLEFL